MSSEYSVRYLVNVTKKARKDGEKLGLSAEAKRSIVEELKQLKYWPETKDIFDYEKVAGAFKFNFDFVEGKWIRVFVYQDDVRKIMWIFKVIAKKTNKLTQTDITAVEAFVREIELEIKMYEEKMLQQQKPQLKVIKGGKDGR